MKPLLLLAAFLLPCVAVAGGPCPKGSNVKLTDNTTASTQTTQADTTGSDGMTTDRHGFKNHFPH